jgi:hypothetical protein
MTVAQALTLQAEANQNGVTLSWFQDDFETLAGYNIYRSNTEDGFYTKINTSIIPNNVTTYLDANVQPGTRYYYNFTVILTDFSESLPSGKTSITTYDSIAPNIFHQPLAIAYINNNLVISAVVTDNLATQHVKLFFRIKGTSIFQSITMTKLNAKYSALISANFITEEGLEYYIEAYDGYNYTYSGTTNSPYEVLTRESNSIIRKGDVNGDNKVTVLDALMMLQAINDIINLNIDQFERADLNGDGILTAAEALRILQFANGSISSL